MNPKVLNIEYLAKLHKTKKTLKTIFTWHGALLYRLSKYRAVIINQQMHIPNMFNIRNFISAINELKSVEVNQHSKLYAQLILRMRVIIHRKQNSCIQHNVFLQDKINFQSKELNSF
jgi:hypothetical protein